MVTANQYIAELYVGGLIGSERYGHIRNCASQGNIIVNNAPKVILDAGNGTGQWLYDADHLPKPKD
jgi:hypothetical protein